MPKIEMKECTECGKEARCARDDYLCIECRAQSLTYEPMNEACQMLVNLCIDVWPGWVMVRDNYDSPHDGWVEIALVEPDATSQSFAMAVLHHSYAIWKHTGDIYRVGFDSAVEDDPIPRDEFLAFLTSRDSDWS